MYSITILVHLRVFKYFKKGKTSGKKSSECKMCVYICLSLLSKKKIAVICRCMQECVCVSL